MSIVVEMVVDGGSVIWSGVPLGTTFIPFNLRLFRLCLLNKNRLLDLVNRLGDVIGDDVVLLLHFGCFNANSFDSFFTSTLTSTFSQKWFSTIKNGNVELTEKY